GPLAGPCFPRPPPPPAAPPPDAAPAVFGPPAVQLPDDRPQHPVVARQRARPLDGEAEPCDVVVERVGPTAPVAQPHAAGERGDGGRAPRARVAQLGVDEAVEQVRLPPV